MYSYLISFDVRCNTRRRHLNKVLISFGERVQYSVFEVFVTHHNTINKLKNQALACLNDDDELRIYYIPSQARKRCFSSGPAPAAEPSAFVIL